MGHQSCQPFTLREKPAKLRWRKNMSMQPSEPELNFVEETMISVPVMAGRDKPLPLRSGLRVDWDDAPAMPNFYGREEEQALLFQWIVQEDCRVVSVLGMGGIGKSTLSVNIMHQLTERTHTCRGGSGSSLHAC